MITVAANPIELIRIKSFTDKFTLSSAENQPENPVKYSSAR
jgi:hypothetical protein